MIRLPVSTLILLALLGTALRGGPVHAGQPQTDTPMRLVQQVAQTPAASPTYNEVAAILKDSCTLCHGPPSPAAGLALDTHEGLMKGGRSGPAVVPGDPGKSEMIRRLRGLSEPRMPLSGPPWLPEEKIALIEQWIRAGAGEAGSMGSSGKQSTGEQEPPAPKTGQPVLFGQVSPIFQARCVKCHAARGQLGPPPEGIRLDSYEALIKGGERPILIPGVPGASALLRSVLGQSRPRMPMDGPPYLDPAETDLIALWIQEGARDEAGTKAPVPAGARIRLGGTLTDHWSIDGTPFTVDGKTRIKKRPAVGAYVQIRAVVAPQGDVHATEIRAR